MFAIIINYKQKKTIYIYIYIYIVRIESIALVSNKSFSQDILFWLNSRRHY